jgi:hypothetical protein
MSDAAPLAAVSPSRPDGKSSSAVTRPRSQAGLIEIELGDGRQVRVGSDVNLLISP